MIQALEKNPISTDPKKKHLFAKLDGTTTGPNNYSGAIGKLLDDCEKRSVVVFEKIEGMLPNISNVKDLSSDQRYLYDITSAVLSGKCSSDLSNRSPGKMSHARWLTKANRILRLYRNAFFAHPENLLLSMLSDEQKHVRELAARRILKARKSSESLQHRVFEVPKINLNASSYIDLIGWQQSYS
ncbi:hypothetical protein RN001_008873 [Aquatica leii]|uniref:Uncharacterized protein n=1 Tax=Aquatica leii TaxID=1421715 RepID=A0AAN7SH41_9COLE|nr:hypothetical protein RN001_008873 [Aquatica leii]